MKGGRRKISDHVTILMLAIGISAVVGAAAGVSTSALIGGFAFSDLFTRWATGGSAAAPTHPVNELEEQTATISAVGEVSPSVVSVLVRAPVPKDVPANMPAVDIGGGTGFFVSQDGLILTNRHVIQGASATYAVVTNDGVELPARVVATDPYLDVAVLDVAGTGYPAVTFGDSDGLRIGQTVIAIGNTLSAFRNTVTRGVVSGLDRRVVAGDEFGGDELLERAIQTDASINPGNSGGPLLTLTGEVVGMNTALSQDAQGVGFAIPVNDLKRAVSDVQAHGRIIHAWLGVHFLPLTPEVVADKKFPVKDGAWIAPMTDGSAAIVPGSPAEKAGLREGDILISIDGKGITQDDGLSHLISAYRPGDVVTVRVVRGEEQFDLPVTLGDFDQPAPASAPKP